MKVLFLILFSLFAGTPLIRSQIVTENFESQAPGESYTLKCWKEDGLKTADWENGMNMRSTVDSSFSVSGKNSLRIKFPKGFSGPAENGAQIPIVLTSRDQYYVSYWLRFSDNFSFRQGGKLPGLAAGAICSGGEICDGTNGFTARFMWEAGGKAILYLYHMDKPGKWGDASSLIYPSGDSVKFERAKWYQIRERVKINSSANNYDGEVEVWINNLPVLIRKGVRFTSNEEKVDRFYFSTFHGGSGPDWAPTETCYIWFDNIVISENKEDVEIPTELLNKLK